MKEAVHFRFMVDGEGATRQITDLDSDPSILVRSSRTEKFAPIREKSPGGVAEPVLVPKEPSGFIIQKSGGQVGICIRIPQINFLGKAIILGKS